MGPIMDRTKEHLGTADATIIRVRRRMLEAARALRERGVTPPGVESPRAVPRALVPGDPAQGRRLADRAGRLALLPHHRASDRRLQARALGARRWLRPPDPLRRRARAEQQVDLGLKGKVAVVTGGSEGIGRGAAQSLGREGARWWSALGAPTSCSKRPREVAEATGAQIVPVAGGRHATPATSSA